MKLLAIALLAGLVACGEPNVSDIYIGEDSVVVYCHWPWGGANSRMEGKTLDEAREKCFKRLREVMQPAEKAPK